MFAITQEHLSFIGGVIAIVAFVKGITNNIDNKIEKNNQYLENLIDKKLDIIVYEANKKSIRIQKSPQLFSSSGFFVEIKL